MKKLLLLSALSVSLSACGAIEQFQNALEGDKPHAVIKTSVTLAEDHATMAPPFGHLQAGGLHSLKYYITSMGICQTAKIHGTGFNMGPDCITLYEAPADSRYSNVSPSVPETEEYIHYTEEYIHYTEVARGDLNNPNFIDLMDPASRASMARTVTLSSEQAGAYQYGFIYWYYPIKIKAEVVLEDGTVLYTHDGETKFVDHGNGNGTIVTQSATPFTEGPAEEAVFVQSNGGNWFKFQSPFEITASDIENATAFQLKLAFNPEGAVKGIGADWGGNNNALIDGDINTPGGTNQFAIPLLDLAPVILRANETALRESYVFDVSAPTEGAGFNQFQIRYDLYYAEPRPEAILAIETKTLATPQTTREVSYGWNVSFIESDAAGALTFKRWDDTPILTGFVRGKAAGDSVQATLHCLGSAGVFEWCDESGTNALTGKLVSISPVGE